MHRHGVAATTTTASRKVSRPRAPGSPSFEGASTPRLDSPGTGQHGWSGGVGEPPPYEAMKQPLK